MELTGLIVALVPCVLALAGMAVNIAKSAKTCRKVKAQLKALKQWA